MAGTAGTHGNHRTDGAAGTDGTHGSDQPVETDARRALRAQLLATEHWSLLASRSTTQSEILSRVTIFLTLVSAGLAAAAVTTAIDLWTGYGRYLEAMNRHQPARPTPQA